MANKAKSKILESELLRRQYYGWVFKIMTLSEEHLASESYKTTPRM